MVDASEVKEKLEKCDPERVEIHPHLFEQALKRNLDPGELNEKLLRRDFEEARDNDQEDSRFEYSYKVSLISNGDHVEVPIYFNIPGKRILVKSIWQR